MKTVFIAAGVPTAMHYHEHDLVGGSSTPAMFEADFQTARCVRGLHLFVERRCFSLVA